MPLTIVIAIGLLILYVYPAYSNGSDGLMDKYNQLKSENAQLVTVKNKVSDLKSLESQLSADSADVATLKQFIPDRIYEEQILDNLNYLASSQGMAVMGITITQPNTGVAGDGTAVSSSANAADSSAPANSSGAGVAPVSAVTATEFAVKYSVLGTYAQVKDLLQKLNGYGRYNEVASIDIEKSASQNSGTQNPAPGNNLLQVDLGLNFDYLKTSISGAGLEISGNKLNTDIVSQIRSSQNVPVLKLNVGQQGKSDPFAL